MFCSINYLLTYQSPIFKISALPSPALLPRIPVFCQPPPPSQPAHDSYPSTLHHFSAFSLFVVFNLIALNLIPGLRTPVEPSTCPQYRFVTIIIQKNQCIIILLVFFLMNMLSISLPQFHAYFFPCRPSNQMQAPKQQISCFENSPEISSLQVTKMDVLQQQKMSLPFSVLIPGQAVFTNFECNNNIYHMDLPNPRTIANISVFLIQPIPEHYAITLNFSLPPYNNMQYLGAIANQKPSDTFSTGFPFKPEFQNASSVKLCLQAQSFEEIANLVRSEDGQQEYSKLVAHNLYNFMMSYHNPEMLINNANGKEYLVMPSDVFTKWMKKFDEKYAKDPNFILKTSLD